jgi:hypothetical protein
MSDNWAVVLNAARELPREQRRWIGRELLKTDAAVDTHDDKDDLTAKHLAENDWTENDWEWKTLIQHFRRNANTGESSELETVFANHKLFADV